LNNLFLFIHNNTGDTMNYDVNEALQILFRSTISLITLFLIAKMLGKKQVSQLSLFDYVIGISIGNFAAEMTINLESHFLNGTIAVIYFGLVAYLVSILTMKSIRLRRYFMGAPTILIENGKIIKANLKKVKFDINDMLEECRGNGYFDTSEIAYAIMEANGKLSILPKSIYQNATREDLNLKNEKVGLCANVIVDGKIMKENLKNCNKDEKWLISEVKKQNKKIGDILLGTVDVNSKLVLFEDTKDYLTKDVLE